MFYRLDIGTAREDGHREGKIEGRLEAIQETIKNMLKKKMPDDMIREITGINQKELEKQKALLQA